MKIWEIRATIEDRKCPFYNPSFRNCTETLEGCTYENCPIKIENEPITAEWLESVGATSRRYNQFWKRYSVDVQSSSITLSVEIGMPGVSRLMVFVGQYGELPHVKTRQDFADLFFRLSGRRLGE